MRLDRFDLNLLVVFDRGTIDLLVIGTQRTATLHRRMAEHFAAYLPLRLLPAPFEMPPLAEVMCWPRHLDRDPAHEWFRRVLLDCAA